MSKPSEKATDKPSEKAVQNAMDQPQMDYTASGQAELPEQSS